MAITSEQYGQIAVAVTRLISESKTADETLRSVLDFVAEACGWDFAALWRMDYTSVVLRCAHTWRRDPARFRRFDTVTRVRTFGIGVGLPGQALLAKEAVWVRDVVAHPNFPRASVAEQDGLHSGVDVPIKLGNRVLGTMEFISTQVIEHDLLQVNLLTSIGAQLAQFFERVGLEHVLTGGEPQYQVLAQSSVDAIITIDEQSLILYVNPAAEELFGYTSDEMRGQRLTMIIPPDLRARHDQGMRRYLESGEKRITWDGIELPALHKSGERMPVEIAFGEFTTGGKRVFSGYVRRKA